MNHKRVYGLYCDEGLAVRRQRLKAEARRPLVLPRQANQLWTMDFTHDNLASGRKFRTLNRMDGYTRESPRMEMDTSLPGLWVVRALEEVARELGYPQTIQVDNGPEFISRVVDPWAFEHGVELHFIEPGKPTQNAFIESFNGTLRAECLDTHWFGTLEESKETIEAWQREYNESRPHRALGERTPNEFALDMVQNPRSAQPTPELTL